MFHPNTLIQLGHDREAELVRESAACGVGQTERTEGRPARWQATLYRAFTIVAAIVNWLLS